MSAFWASWTPCYICWVRHVLTLALPFKSLKKSRMGSKLLEFGGIRLVINQSVVHVKLESSPEDRSCVSAVCYLRLYSYTKYVIYWTLSIDITLIYSYMWDLTSRAHIWCVFGFVLKIGCYKRWPKWKL